jgi:type IV secretion system protein VirB5
MAAETKNWSPLSPLDTPYKKARAEWDSRMGTLVVQAKNWRLATFFSLALVLLALLGMVYLGTLPKLSPHIVEVNTQSGAAHYKGPPLAPSATAFTPSRALITYHLRRFILDVRELSSDKALVKQNCLDAYHFLSSEGASILNEYFRQHNPLERVGLERVTVEVTSMVQMSKDSWQCDWSETRWNMHGKKTGSTLWRGIFRLALKAPKHQTQLEQNPIGLFIEEFHWSEVKP